MSKIIELFGHSVDDLTDVGYQDWLSKRCPVINATCPKRMQDGSPSGVCSLETNKGERVPICPLRMYANDYKILRDIARRAFGAKAFLIRPDQIKETEGKRQRVVAFGKNWGGEITVDDGGRRTSVDWLLARIDARGNPKKFMVVEIQTSDVGGSNYRAAREALLQGCEQPSMRVGLNWENVNKRIIPQLIAKGNKLSSERNCAHGLWLVCPEPIYRCILYRLGGNLVEFASCDRNSITFCPYVLNEKLELVPAPTFTTTVGQVSSAFASLRHMTEHDAFEKSLRRALAKHAAPDPQLTLW